MALSSFASRLLHPLARKESTSLSPRPLLAVDVDGVVNLLGADQDEVERLRFELIGGHLRCISLGAGDCLRSLALHFDLYWASGWGKGECEALAELLGLAGVTHLSFGSDARFGTAHWKTGVLEAVGRERPLAWVDDNFDDRCREWAAQRPVPTLLVGTEPQSGLGDLQCVELIAWAQGIDEFGDHRTRSGAGQELAS